MFRHFWAALVLLSSLLPIPSMGESVYLIRNNGTITGSARLDFNIIVPKVIYLRVGSGSNWADNAAINLIDFSVPAASIGNGSPIPATAGSGDLGNGIVTARVSGNNGDIVLSASTTGPLDNGSGDAISYSQISVASAALTSASPLPHPGFVDGGSASASLASTNRVVDRDARWTYSYANTVPAAGGSYGGANIRGGRVTYTASMP